MASGFNLTATARRLLNMEVNTILCDAMIADPMPAVPHALLDVATNYADMLTNLGVDLAPFFTAAAANRSKMAVTWLNPPAWVGDALKVSSDTFDALRWAADRASSSSEAVRRIKNGQGALLERIVNNSDTIKEMFKRFDTNFMNQFGDKTRTDLLKIEIRPSSYVVAPDDLTLLQKIWDIGTAEIVAQTIVYLTGDVTTRVKKSLGRAESEPIFNIHRQSIDISVNCWKSLLDAIREIAGAAVSVLLGVKK